MRLAASPDAGDDLKDLTAKAQAVLRFQGREHDENSKSRKSRYLAIRKFLKQLDLDSRNEDEGESTATTPVRDRQPSTGAHHPLEYDIIDTAACTREDDDTSACSLDAGESHRCYEPMGTKHIVRARPHVPAYSSDRVDVPRHQHAQQQQQQHPRTIVSFPGMHTNECKVTWNRNQPPFYCIFGCESNQLLTPACESEVRTCGSMTNILEDSNVVYRFRGGDTSQGSIATGRRKVARHVATHACGCETRASNIYNRAAELDFGAPRDTQDMEDNRELVAAALSSRFAGRRRIR